MERHTCDYCDKPFTNEPWVTTRGEKIYFTCLPSCKTLLDRALKNTERHQRSLELGKYAFNVS